MRPRRLVTKRRGGCRAGHAAQTTSPELSNRAPAESTQKGDFFLKKKGQDLPRYNTVAVGEARCAAVQGPCRCPGCWHRGGSLAPARGPAKISQGQGRQVGWMPGEEKQCSGCTRSFDALKNKFSISELEQCMGQSFTGILHPAKASTPQTAQRA